MKHVTHFVNGKSWTGASERQGDVYDPATGSIEGRVGLASARDVDEVVQAAAAAFPGWRDTSLARRTAVMFAVR